MPGDWRNEVYAADNGLCGLNRIGGNRYTFDDGDTRQAFKNYFNSADGESECPWQLDHVRSLGRNN